MNINLPKILVTYLPQFHETEDNNKWWGKGFTDWESVKLSKKYFDEHEAPWVPLYEDYYDLRDINSMKKQAELAKAYGIDGFCFYHYYFKNGKMELEYPAENLLNHPEIDMSFCFNWANESWIRSWSKLSGNVWSENFEEIPLTNESGVLVEQDYGDESLWKLHFEYLLKFFKDDRYIKLNGKPVFIFYRPNSIECIEEMTSLWQKMAMSAGFKGMYFVSVNLDANLCGMDASLIYEPRCAMTKLNFENKPIVKNGVRCFDCAEVWDKVLKSTQLGLSRTYYMGFSGYDDTPRRGNKGECIINNNVELFKKNIKHIIEKSMAIGNEFLFINAWNEWGEGMYLEPDVKKGTSYLAAIKTAIEDIDIASIRVNRENVSKIDYEKQAMFDEIKKYKKFLSIYDKWLYLIREHKFNLREYLKEQNVETVAIYGMAMLGKQMYNELLMQKIRVIYGIDCYVGQYGELNIYRPEDTMWPEVDLVIVAVYDEKKVANFIAKKIDAKVMLLSELIDNFVDR